ncbi:MAG: ATP-binding protein [Candidatus ainarchaeum sp.]|nr:ATP-binding protein [Candidatus ainarchaeum sp.]
MLDKNIVFRIFEESKEKYKIPLKKRLLFDSIIPVLNYKEALVLSGVRRCGKTSLMFALMQYLDGQKEVHSKVYINFEDERLAFIEPKDLDLLIEYYLEFENPKGKVYFFFDEIQNVPLWEKWVSRLYEKYKFILSGSNAKLLSSDLASALTGRYKEFRVYPFSFKEFVGEFKLNNTIESNAKAKRLFGEFVIRGGFPESLLFNKTDLLQEYYRNILLKDVIGRYNIKYKSLIEKLSLFILSNIGKTISLYSLEKNYDAGINTIKNYIGYLESSFLIFSIDLFAFSIKKQQNSPSKFFAVDIALAQSVSFEFTKNDGRKLENIVLIELKSKCNEIYYYKEKFECDFIIKKGLNIVEAIQVCYQLNEENKVREISGLIDACKTHNLKEGLLLTFDEEEIFQKDDIKIEVKPVWKWLLE